MIDQAKVEVLHRTALELASLEEKMLPPNQRQFDKLYQEIYAFMSEAIQEAQRQNKLCLFVLGEQHQTKLAKNSFIVQQMFALIGHQLGIKDMFFETWPERMQQAKGLRKTFVASKNHGKDSPANIKNVDTLEIFYNLIMRTPVLENFRLHALEKERSKIISHKAREKVMRETLMTAQVSGIVVTGLFHVEKICEHAEMDKTKFLIYPVNTWSHFHMQSFVKNAVMLDKDPAGTEKFYKAVSDYVFNQTKVKQFILSGKFVETDTNLLLKMVDKAHQNILATRLLDEGTKRDLFINQEYQKAEPVLTMGAKFLPVNDHVPQLSFSQAAEAKLPQVSYQTVETVPASVLIRAGFWLASKLNFCENPREALPVLSETMQALKLQQSQEQAAELHFKKQGSSLEAALYSLLGKGYSKANVQDKAQWKQFFIDVVNGNVSQDLGQKFNQGAHIKNAVKRRDHFQKLLQQHRLNIMGYPAAPIWERSNLR